MVVVMDTTNNVMETPAQLMPPPAINGAASMSNGQSDSAPMNNTANDESQNQVQYQPPADADNNHQSISAGNIWLLLSYTTH